MNYGIKQMGRVERHRQKLDWLQKPIVDFSMPQIYKSFLNKPSSIARSTRRKIVKQSFSFLKQTAISECMGISLARRDHARSDAHFARSIDK